MIDRKHRNWHADAPLVIAHRGASLQAPENTLAAFRLSADLDADAIELDAKLTRDRRVVIHHDTRLERTTNGEGRVSDWDLKELKRLDAGGKFDTRFRNERIPTLEEVIQVVGDRLLFNVELTNYTSPFDSLPERAIEIILRHEFQTRVLISSFNPVALLRVRRMFPDIRCGLLVKSSEPKWLRRLLRIVVPHDAIHPSYDILDEHEMDEYVRERKSVFAWTVNDHADVAEMLRLGVDGIISDDPVLVRNAMAADAQSSLGAG